MRSDLVILRDLVPIHHVPPRLDVIGPAVLVIEIIGVLPDVDAEDRRVAVHQRAVLVRRGNHFELAALVLDQPGPAAAEAARPGRREFFLERVEAAEGGFDVVAQFAGRFAAGVRAHDFPEEGMVRVTAAVVAHGGANVFGHGVEILDQILDRFRGELGLVFERVVDVGDVSLVMLGVMDFHRPRVDVRLERVVGVREFW